MRPKKYTLQSGTFGRSRNSIRPLWVLKTTLFCLVGLLIIFSPYFLLSPEQIRSIGRFTASFITGTWGLLFILVFLLYSFASFKNGSVRPCMASALIVIGLVFIRLGTAAFMSGQPLEAERDNAVVRYIKKAHTAGEKKTQTASAASMDKVLGTKAGTPEPVPTSKKDETVPQQDVFASLSQTLESKIVSRTTLPSAEKLVDEFTYHYEPDPTKPFAVLFDGAPSPFHPDAYLLRIGLKATTSSPQQTRAWHVIFVLDMSTLKGNPGLIAPLKESLHNFITKMNPEDQVGIIPLGDSTDCILPLVNSYKQQEIQAGLDGVEASGDGPGFRGLERAFAGEIKPSPHTQAQVVIFTDGEFTSDPENVIKLSNIIQQQRPHDAVVSIVGYKPAPYNRNSMRRLSSMGHGNYLSADSPDDLKTIISEDAIRPREIVAEGVKMKLEFNPSLVTNIHPFDKSSSRLNETASLEPDIASVAEAGHEETLLYELTLAPSLFASTFPRELGSVKLASVAADSGTQTEYTYPVPSTSIKQSIELASEDYRLAAAAAGFGMLLAHNDQAGSMTFAQIKALLSPLKGSDPYGKRKQFLHLVDEAISANR